MKICSVRFEGTGEEVILLKYPSYNRRFFADYSLAIAKAICYLLK